jgi:hypothetical protein
VKKIIVALSGGKASAWCADWALKKYNKSDVILYFNDTKWEHPDLYRFLNDLEKYFGHKITYDSDGRSPEQLFYDERALANNRMAFCSRILKAKRLQNYYKDDDTIIFGINFDEKHRANRIDDIYQRVSFEKNKWPNLIFPLIQENISENEINKFLLDINIKEPILYSLGFSHNNCSGGCVRAGKKHWKLLYEKLPEIYFDRERVEENIRLFLNKDIHFFKDETLKEFRKRIENKELSSYYYNNKKEKEIECVGICDTET